MARVPAQAPSEVYVGGGGSQEKGTPPIQGDFLAVQPSMPA